MKGEREVAKRYFLCVQQALRWDKGWGGTTEHSKIGKFLQNKSDNFALEVGA